MYIIHIHVDYCDTISNVIHTHIYIHKGTGYEYARRR